MHTRPALYQRSYSPVPYRYFKVRLLASYPIFPQPPSPLCCTQMASITATVKKCIGILASFLISQPDFAWTESMGSFMYLKEELVLEPGRRHTRECGLLQNSVRVFSTETRVWYAAHCQEGRGKWRQPFSLGWSPTGAEPWSTFPRLLVSAHTKDHCSSVRKSKSHTCPPASFLVIIEKKVQEFCWLVEQFLMLRVWLNLKE